MNPQSASPGTPPIVGLVGAGITGRAVAWALTELGYRVALYDIRRAVAQSVAGAFGARVVDAAEELTVADLVVLAHPAPHHLEAERFLGDGVSVVSLSDDLADVEHLLTLGHLARSNSASIVVGAGLSPGLSGLLARYLAPQVPQIEEVHVAVHGTGGPACAHHHHRSLANPGMAWHDGEWLERIGGSGRELCWFPEPIGARDCYRAELADPRVLHRCFPDANRISARVSATRRDRLTARLPMLIPPHSGGNEGAVRVEVRGADDEGQRLTSIVGVAGRVGDLAGATAATAAWAVLSGLTPPGVVALADDEIDHGSLIGQIQRFGVRLQEFTGIARSTSW